MGEVGEVTREDKEKLQAIEKEYAAQSYTVISTSPMRDLITVIISQQAHVQSLINNSITVTSISLHPLPTMSA